MEALTDDERLLIKSALGIFVARNWKFDPATIASWVYSHTGYTLTAEQVRQYIREQNFRIVR